ncbi:PACE efflux transporter [Sulfitobacter sp. M39]|uniref:PACE efflux transporter n=1 Tax=Sulfitobacter sp. M39 TaxID=2675334 RepID=UPI001F27ACE0|nr:PACE efflux transporter [Sulfitobacter sp. M39]MCF7747090.1 PACE efflux transporter [Sulfitobacter sp. M39]
MRSAFDRLRHAISFEVIALILVIPAGAILFDVPLHDFGVVGIVSATLATLWNLGYNVLFDLALQRLTGTTLKSRIVRVLHALAFEAGLLVVLLPFIAWYLGISLWDAFVLDIALAAFYLVYAYVFNLIYDTLFPLPEWSQKQAESA